MSQLMVCFSPLFLLWELSSNITISLSPIQSYYSANYMKYIHFRGGVNQERGLLQSKYLLTYKSSLCTNATIGQFWEINHMYSTSMRL